jgi:hypothetical protein
MSSFTDFVHDFPNRCQELLSLIEEPATTAERDVTLLLVVTATALGVPFERLRPDGIFPHASRDNKTFKKEAEDLKTLLDEDFIGSELWDRSADSWCFGDLASSSGKPDQWPELEKPTSIVKGVKTGPVIHTLRNSLAHGNIFTKISKPIEHIVLWSSKRKENHAKKNAQGRRTPVHSGFSR